MEAQKEERQAKWSAEERLFIMATGIVIPAVSLFGVCENLCVNSFTKGNALADLTRICVVTICFLICMTLSYFAIKKKKMKRYSPVIALILVLVLIPEAALLGVGSTAIWFLTSVLYVEIMMEGKMKRLFLITDLIWCSGYIYWCYRWDRFSAVSAVPEEVKYVNVYLTLLVVAILMISLLEYQVRLQKESIGKIEMQKEEIDSLNKSQSRFFSSMSHEIRTPINTIIGLNEMILREDASDEINENAANIQSASKMLLHLINDILDMSKFESGEMRLTPVQYHTGDMLSDIVGMLWLRAKEKGLAFHISVAPDLPEVLMGDEVRIKQILINVLNNAIKYTAEGSVTLNIQCDRKGEENVNVIYTVTDTGIGIKKENIPFLFTAFRRVDEEKNRRIEGTGLGLAIVKQFVDLMGGKITVNSVYTKGSTFIIEIPQKIVSAKPIGEMDMERRHSLLGKTMYKQSFEAPEAKVLVVDDTAANLLVVKKLLRQTKVQVTTVGSGAEALEKTLEENYHVIFMDHLMPRMDGIECMHKIKMQVGGRCKDAKIVALTANAGSDIEHVYEKEGFDGYLLKPITGEEIETQLRFLLPKDLVTLTGDGQDILQESLSWRSDHQKKAHVMITTESVADLPAELIEKYQIAILPHMVSTAKGIFRDGLEIEQQGLLAYMEKNVERVNTLAPDVAMHEAFFATQLAHANNVIHISISSMVATSGCHAAMEAAKAFDNVFVVDTWHLSSGQGLMVLEAARMAKEGKSAEEIVAELERMKSSVHTSFIVENLDYLARANQVGKRIANVTKAFMIHPVLVLKKGKMGVGMVLLGSRDRAWRGYVNSVLDGVRNIDTRILFVTYVGLSQSELKEIKKMINRKMSFEKIYFQKASPAIAVNCGPGTFGLLYQTKR